MPKSCAWQAVFVLALLFLQPCRAAGEMPVMELKEALETALEQNHGLRALANSVEAGSSGVGIARSRLMPKITFEERFTRTNNPPSAFSIKLNQERFSQPDFAIDSLNHPDEINDFQTTVSIEQPLFVRKASIGLRMAKTDYSAGLKDLRREREAVAYSVVRGYLSTQAARQYVVSAKKSVEDATEHLRIARLRFDNGLGLYSDVLRATTNLKQAEQRLISSVKNLKLARRGLGLLLGRTDSIGVKDEPVEVALHDADYYIGASATRSDLKAVEIRRENAENGVKLANAGYFPVVGVGANYMMNDHRTAFGDEGDSWQVSAFLRWNVFDGSLRRHESSRARHLAEEAEERLNGLKNQIRFSVYGAYLDVQEAEKNAELAASALETAAEGERLVRKRYENSLSPIVDLLDAEASLDAARADLISRKVEYSGAVARLAFESGTLLKDIGLE